MWQCACFRGSMLWKVRQMNKKPGNCDETTRGIATNNIRWNRVEAEFERDLAAFAKLARLSPSFWLARKNQTRQRYR